MTKTQSDKESHVVSYTGWLASSLARYEALAKSLVEHKPEKGRIVEGVMKAALRTILPGRFSIGTGFAVTASGRASPQLDIVIYDGMTNAPILLEGGTGLFPIECIFGFIEVKSTLDNEEIDKATKAIKTVRGLADEKRFVSYVLHDDGAGNKVAREVEGTEAPTIAPRSFVFAINSTYATIQGLEEAVRRSTENSETHIHGLATIDKNWFIHQRPTFSKRTCGSRTGIS